MFNKRYVIVSLANLFPVFLSIGKASLFDNFRITGVDFHFSTTMSFAVRVESEVEAEVWIGGIMSFFPRFAPLSIIVVYDILTMVEATNDPAMPIELLYKPSE